MPEFQSINHSKKFIDSFNKFSFEAVFQIGQGDSLPNRLFWFFTIYFKLLIDPPWQWGKTFASMRRL